MNNSKNNKLSKLSADFIRLKSEISAIVTEGHEFGLSSEAIVEKILSRVVIDEEIMIEENTAAARPVYMKDILLIARIAVEQAEFDGVSAILPSGERIKRKVNLSLKC